jgi:parvulin-like peptidyl-prolyl isomerase
MLLPAVALVAGACGSETSSQPAATVNGEEISAQAVIDELTAIDSNEDYVTFLEARNVQVRGSREGAFNTAFVSQVLNRQITYLLVHQEVVRRNLSVEAACRDAAQRDIYLQTGANDAALGQAMFEQFPQAYRDQLVAWNTDVFTLQSDLGAVPCVTDAAVEEYYEANQDQLEQVCLAHILVATEEEADEILADLEDGGDFATIAAERSTDTGSGAQGGDLGCAPRGSFVAPFEEAAFEATPGEFTGPVQTEFGFHVLLVDRFETPSLEEARSQIEQNLTQAGDDAFIEWISGAVTSATVTVDDVYGEWDPATGRITPPAVEVEVPEAPTP